jgi:hydroxypyruvate isomerase
MNRRQFVNSCTVAGLGAAVGRPSALSGEERLLDSPSSPAPFLLSVMLWTVEPKLPFEQRIAKVAEAGYHAVELVGEWQGWSKDEFLRARRQLHKLGMVVDASSGVHASLCDPGQRDALLGEIRALVPILGEFECARLILLTGDRVPGLSHEQMRANCVESLRRAADLTAPQSVEILLETIDPEENPKYFLASVAEGFQVVREIGHPRIKLLYDFFHEQVAEGNLIAKLEKNLDLLGLVHIADVPGRHEPGTGEINFANIYRKLGQLGYSRYVAMEFIPTGDVVASLRIARELAEKCGAEGQALKSQDQPAAGVLAKL